MVTSYHFEIFQKTLKGQLLQSSIDCGCLAILIFVTKTF